MNDVDFKNNGSELRGNVELIKFGMGADGCYNKVSSYISHDYSYVKWLARCDEPTENYQPTLEFPLTLRTFITTYSNKLFRFSGPQLHYFGSLSTLIISINFSRSRQLFSEEKLLPAQHQTTDT